jgi:hypothetical protein
MGGSDAPISRADSGGVIRYSDGRRDTVDQGRDGRTGLLNGDRFVLAEAGELGEWSELWRYQFPVVFDLDNFISPVLYGHDYPPSQVRKSNVHDDWSLDATLRPDAPSPTFSDPSPLIVAVKFNRSDQS